MKGVALNPRGIAVPDCPRPLFQYGLPDLPHLTRVFEPFIAALLPDEEAWAALFTDDERLANFRCCYGNRKGKRPKRRTEQGTLL